MKLRSHKGSLNCGFTLNVISPILSWIKLFTFSLFYHVTVYFPPAPSLHFEQYLLCQELTLVVNQSTTPQRGRDSPDKDGVGAACSSERSPHTPNEGIFSTSKTVWCLGSFFGSWFRNKTEILRHDVDCPFQSPVL